MPLKAIKTPFAGLFVIERNLLNDNRGYFDGLFDFNFFKNHCGLQQPLDRVNLSFNTKKGTLRGLHRQKNPYSEAKTVTCLQGKIFDVALDLREKSPTYGQHFSLELDEEEAKMLFIPAGFAHGFQTLQDNSKVLYFTDHPYSPPHEEVFNAFDPTFNIAWPLPVSEISMRDGSRLSLFPSL